MSTGQRPVSPTVAVPAVSVIIPAYGVNEYIADAVDSVLAQTYTNYEVFVVNDGTGPEETAELKAILATYGDRVRYLERENGGQAAARNTALRVSTAPFFALLDGDDYWHPTLLEREMELFARDPGLSLVYTDARLFGDHPWAGRTYMECGDDSVGEVTVESLLARRVNPTMSTMVVRREDVIAAGWFDESLRYVEDYDMWLRMAYRGMRMTYIHEPLAYRRLRATSLSANGLKMERSVLHVLEQFGRTHELTGSALTAWQDAVAIARSRLGLTLAKMSLSNGHVDTAAEALRGIRTADASWKLRAAGVGLRAVPSVVSVAYRCWSWLLDARLRRETARARRRAAPPRPRRPTLSPAGPGED
jgi:GT2 family glycosyltransferase